jgi:hypothetical protein
MSEATWSRHQYAAPEASPSHWRRTLSRATTGSPAAQGWLRAGIGDQRDGVAG